MRCCKQSTRKTASGWKLPVLVLAISFGVIIAVAATRGGDGGRTTIASAGDGRIVVEPARQDMGEVRMRDGIRTLTYAVKNTGSETLILTDMETSCMCTTAYVEVDGEKSPVFGMRAHGGNPGGWSQAIEPGQSGALIVKFDPNAHGPSGVGPVSRTITIRSNDKTSPVVQVRLDGTVVP